MPCTYAMHSMLYILHLQTLTEHKRGLLTKCHLPRLQGDKLASELAQKLPAAALAALIGSLSVADVAKAADYYTPPSSGGSGSTVEAVKQQAQKALQFPSSTPNAPALKGSSSSGDFQLPEGNQWRYSEFVNAVQGGKVERVRFSKEGGQLQARSCPAFSKSTASMPTYPRCHSLANAPAESMCGFSHCVPTCPRCHSLANAPAESMCGFSTLLVCDHLMRGCF